MDGTSREARVSAAFVTLADTLTTNFDVVDLLHTLVEECAGILNVEAGGLMLADAEGHLQLMTSTSESADLVEIMQLGASTASPPEPWSASPTFNTPAADGRHSRKRPCSKDSTQRMRHQ
jgi:hypothetical protein